MDQSSWSSEGDSASATAGVEAADDSHSHSPTTTSAPDRAAQSFVRGRSVSSCSPSSLTVDSGLCSTSAPSSPTKEMSPVPVPISLRESPPRHAHAPNIQLAARHNIQQFKTDLDHDHGPWSQSSKGSPASETRPSINPPKNPSASSGVAFFEHAAVCLSLGEEALKQSDDMRDFDLKLGATEEAASMESESNSKVYPMAFTVDFGEDTKKSLEITDSISKFAPRHRKNLSLTKGEDFAACGKKGAREEGDASPSQPQQPDKTRHKKGSLANDLQLQSESSTAKKAAAASASCNFNASCVVNGTKPPTVPGSTVKRSSVEDKRTKKTATEKFAHFQRNKPVSMDLKGDISNNNHLRLDSPREHKALMGVQDDNASETGTYTVENESAEVRKARKTIDKQVAETTQEGPGQSGLGWVREWAENASQQRTSSPDTSPELETRGFLHDTENLVSALQRRVSGKSEARKSPHEVGAQRAAAAQQAGRSEKVTSRVSPVCREGSVLSDSGYALGYASDSSNDGRESKNPVKFNRAFAIRRGRLVGYDSDNCVTRQSMAMSFRGASPRPQQHETNASSNSAGPHCSKSIQPPAFSRTDGGRFSLRAPKAKPPNLPFQQREVPLASSNCLGQRLGVNSARVGPGPLKKQGLSLTPNPTRRDFGGGRSNSTLTAKEVELANWKRRKNYDPMKAAQAGHKKTEAADKFCESGSESPGEEISQRVRTPLYKSALVNSSSFSPNARSPQEYYVSGNSDDEDSNEITSSHSSSPTNMMMTRSLHGETHSQHSITRPKNKLEALDSLVISTIHSLSVKVRTCSRQLLEKLQVHYTADENGALLEEMVTQLKDLENATSPTKTTSRELSGTLKNLKKIEQVILVLDRVLCEDESDPA